MTATRNRRLTDRIDVVRARLQEPLQWLPFLGLLGVGLSTTLGFYTSIATNSRVGLPVEQIVFPAPSGPESALRLTVALEHGTVMVSTGDGSVFRWPQATQNLEPLRRFVQHLKVRMGREIAGSALSGRIDESEVKVMIATDQRLKYLHLRPILYALSEAGINRYGFETQLPTTAVASGPEDRKR